MIFELRGCQRWFGGVPGAQKYETPMFFFRFYLFLVVLRVLWWAQCYMDLDESGSDLDESG